MQFGKNNTIFCFLILLLLFFFEIFILKNKTNNFQMEIYLRKIDILKDPPSIVQLLPGVGKKKAQEIIELRKTIDSSSEIINRVGLDKRQSEWDELLDREN